MWVHRSNRVEALARTLAGVVSAPGGSPLAPEVIVVQSRGMERWLSLTIAERLGVWFGARFPFPRAFVDEVMGLVLGEDASAAFSRERLAFGLAAELASGPGPGLEPVMRYLGHDQTGRDLLALAHRVADLFDQYAVYRPELVLSWESGDQDDWQATLWRAAMRRLRSLPGVPEGAPLHVAGRRARFVERFRALEALPAGLPRRVSVFGVSTLPPVYLETLALLSERVDVHLFLLTPSREHTAELRSPREIERALRRVDGLDAAALHLDPGNPLVAALGRAGRDLERVLESVTDYREPPGDRFHDPGTDTLLRAVQHDLLHLVRRRETSSGGDGAADDAPAPLPITDTDRTIELHACPGRMREVEVVHELLREAFEDDPTLEPHQVIVMAPRIADYASLVEAVFGDEPAGTRLPFRVTDRAPADRSPVVSAALQLLEALAGRLTLSQVTQLIEADPIRARFGISSDAVPRAIELLDAAGARWGVDGVDRESVGGTATDANTFRAGLVRLLLGHALGDAGELFAGVAPVVAEPSLLGGLADLLVLIFDWRERLRAPHPVAEHTALFLSLLEEVFVSDAVAAADLELLREAALALGTVAAETGYTAPVPLASFRELLAARLPDRGASVGFLSGGITVSALLPMRSVPFRVVCLLGMNDAEFPRAAPPIRFDRMLDEPRPGDRSVRRDDENLFLEVLLSVRERLIITYVGRSLQDDTERAPSSVVSVLLDALDEGYTVAPPERADGARSPGTRGGVGTRRVVTHPIQRWSPRRFAVHPVTYDPVAAAGARALAEGPRGAVPFLTAPLPRPSGETEIDALVERLRAPARALCRERLGVTFDDRNASFPDGDPLELDARDAWALGADLLAHALDDPELLDAAETWERARARGRLPHGTAGRCAFDAIVAEVRSIVAEVRRWRGGVRLPALSLAIPVGDGRLVGTLDELWPEAQVDVRYSREPRGVELGTWVRHLALQVARAEPGGTSLPSRSVLVTRRADRGGASVLAFRGLAADAARTHLAELIELGALAVSAPTPFFPRAGRAYAEALRRTAPKGPAAPAWGPLERAHGEFDPSSDRGSAPEGTDPYVRRLFGDRDPLAPGFCPWAAADEQHLVPDFSTLAARVYGPLLAAREEGLVGGEEEVPT